MPDQRVQVISEVTRIYPLDIGCYIILREPKFVPKDGIFFLELDHPNYNSLYSLAVVAAVNRYKLRILAKNDIVDTDRAKVRSMWIDWSY